MTKEKLLQLILNNENLKQKYWPNDDLEILNTRTLINSENKNIKSLHYYFEQQLTKKAKSESLFKMFKL